MQRICGFSEFTRMELTDDELKGASEGELFGLMCAVWAFRTHEHPTKGIAGALKIEHGRVNSVLRQETYLGTEIMIRAERLLHVDWYTRWVSLKCEQTKALSVGEDSQRVVPSVRIRNKRSVQVHGVRGETRAQTTGSESPED